MSNKEDTTVVFTQRQFDWLNKQFPERFGTSTIPDAELRFQSGVRWVVSCIRDRIQREHQ